MSWLFIGGPTAALIAYHNPLMTVNVVDLNAERIAAWNSSHLPIHETGLPKIVRIARDGTNEATMAVPGSLEEDADDNNTVRLPARRPSLFFSTNVVASIAEADIIFICVNTPTKMYGIGAGASADLGALEAATRTIAKNAKAGAVIVEKSTVPCGTAKIISDIVSLPDSLHHPLFPNVLSGMACRHPDVRPPRGTASCLSLCAHYVCSATRDYVHTHSCRNGVQLEGKLPQHVSGVGGRRRRGLSETREPLFALHPLP